MIRTRRTKKNHTLIINLNGPEGNAFNLLATANRLAGPMGMDAEAILKEMQNGDYEHLVQTFDDHFGHYVILER